MSKARTIPSRLARLILTVSPKVSVRTLRSRTAGGLMPGFTPREKTFSRDPPGARAAMTSPITLPMSAPRITITSRTTTLSSFLAMVRLLRGSGPPGGRLAQHHAENEQDTGTPGQGQQREAQRHRGNQEGRESMGQGEEIDEQDGLHPAESQVHQAVGRMIAP